MKTINHLINQNVIVNSFKTQLAVSKIYHRKSIQN